MIEGQRHRPADTTVGEERRVDVPGEERHGPFRGRDPRPCLTSRPLRGAPLLRREDELVDLPGPERGEGRGRILDDPEMNLAKGGRVTDRRPVKQRPLVAPPEDDPLPAVPLDNPVRPSADRQGRRITGEKGRVTPPGRLVDVTGNDREVEVPDVRGQWLPMEKDDRPLVVRLDGAELVSTLPDPRLR